MKKILGMGRRVACIISFSFQEYYTINLWSFLEIIMFPKEVPKNKDLQIDF